MFWGSKDCVLPWFGTMGPCLAIGPPGRTQPTAPAQPGADMGFPPVETVLKNWADHNGCSANPVSETLTASVTHRVYESCQAGADLELFFIEGGGHAWPGSAFSTSVGAIVGPTATSIDATDVIWEFFTRHRLT